MDSAPTDPLAAAEEPLDPDLPGPFTVGRWAKGFKRFLAERPRVLLIGEVFNLRHSRTSAFFELRDAEGAVRCSIWNSDLDRLKLAEGALADGAEVVVGGGPDYYPGHKTASPSFSFRATHIRLAGEGDLLAQLDRSRRRLDADGLLTKQAALPRPAIPRTIGVVTARNSAACADLLAGLERRGWRGTIVWADAPVQDRRAAPAIARALADLAALPQVEVAVVCRGGGSLTDLWAFCDENLCRAIALLRLPVISAVGHEVDHTLIDDVAAVSCSTPTHAAEALIQRDINGARAELHAAARASTRAATATLSHRGRRLGELAHGPARAVRLERRRLHQMLREIRASATRGIEGRGELAARHGLVVARKGSAFTGAENAARGQLLRAARTIELRSAAGVQRRGERLATLAQTARAHDPERTLERGYALVADSDGEPVTSAAEARERDRLEIRFADDAVRATVDRERDER